MVRMCFQQGNGDKNICNPLSNSLFGPCVIPNGAPILLGRLFKARQEAFHLHLEYGNLNYVILSFGMRCRRVGVEVGRDFRLLRRQLNDRRAPPAHALRRQTERRHLWYPPQNGVYAFAQLPRPLPMHNPHLQDAPLPALGQILRHQVADFPGREQVQVERAVDGPLQGRWCLAGRVVRHSVGHILSIWPAHFHPQHERVLL